MAPPEPPQLGIDGDADEVELADEPQRHGDTRVRESIITVITAVR